MFSLNNNCGYVYVLYCEVKARMLTNSILCTSQDDDVGVLQLKEALIMDGTEKIQRLKCRDILFAY